VTSSYAAKSPFVSRIGDFFVSSEKQIFAVFADSPADVRAAFAGVIRDLKPLAGPTQNAPPSPADAPSPVTVDVAMPPEKPRRGWWRRSG
jgi:hypothetical protein